MPFHVIRGTFHVVGYSPDGDSVRFRAQDADHWDLLDGPPVNMNGQQHVQLRLEAVDTLETHYRGTHQPPPFTNEAMLELLKFLGITDVVWNESRSMVISANDGSPGYIISRIVEPNRRPVSFVFTGQPLEPDGSQIFFTPERLRESVNYHLLERGLAYPTYYKGLFPDLRNECTAAVAQARADQRAIWGVDRTNAGADVTSPSVITNEAVLLPKLFRRLVEFLGPGGTAHGFRQWLALRQEGVTIISPQVHPTHFDTVVAVEGTHVRMTEPPENLIFDG
jgi:hypothetical protein